MEQYTGIILPHLEEFRQQQHQPQQPEADWVNPEIPGPSVKMCSHTNVQSHQPQQPEADWVNPEIPGPSVKMCSHTNVQSHQPQQPEADWVNPGDTGTVCGME
ncbi:hypothetical protein F3H50_01550 [Escherichia coli]|uniref:hypothetical protein n=1 Tax=Escherichia coli TaxID=562 RepID=UPI0005A84D39|nr:hypothetical protein [Escherichia coli]EFE7937707.1 hypothetical protein [Escherichia coli]EFJ5422510.1 hypothetical protein [Escherichia coli]EIP9766387.1 hypothetical protein [Escherichia coli]ELA4513297.1 hypothetical protein [Escherichia coli]ELH3078883.1 hypothetical protein [Escherichia coli]